MESDSEEVQYQSYTKLLERFNKELDKMTINELINYKVEPIKSIQKLFNDWYNKFNNENDINLKFNYSDGLSCLLPKDLFVV